MGDIITLPDVEDYSLFHDLTGSVCIASKVHLVAIYVATITS